mmetsp:Transcript_11992/g.37961  ORF Transcript_11992/g.37961 Transcript_11992/m.37961 type:complete len:251 (-) Transcript_11992:7-759(-)
MHMEAHALGVTAFLMRGGISARNLARSVTLTTTASMSADLASLPSEPKIWSIFLLVSLKSALSMKISISSATCNFAAASPEKAPESDPRSVPTSESAPIVVMSAAPMPCSPEIISLTSSMMRSSAPSSTIVAILPTSLAASLRMPPSSWIGKMHEAMQPAAPSTDEGSSAIFCSLSDRLLMPVFTESIEMPSDSLASSSVNESLTLSSASYARSLAATIDSLSDSAVGSWGTWQPHGIAIFRGFSWPPCS